MRRYIKRACKPFIPIVISIHFKHVTSLVFKYPTNEKGVLQIGRLFYDRILKTNFLEALNVYNGIFACCRHIVHHAILLPYT